MIVCGLHDVGLRTVEQLQLAGARVVVLDDEADERFARVVRGWKIPQLPRGPHLADTLRDAGIEGAAAVVCIESSDLKTLETVLLVRDLRSDVRIVAHLDNPAVARAVEEITGAATVLDVAALFAPSVIEACLGRRAHDISLGTAHFVTVEVIAPRSGTLRELYGSLVPLGVTTDAEQEPIVCPGRDLRVAEHDRVVPAHHAIEHQAAEPRPAEHGFHHHAAAERGATLTRRPLAFARRQELNPEAVDVTTLVEGMLDG